MALPGTDLAPPSGNLDFSKIFSTNSPLTPFSWSDGDYLKGWEVVGSTPPARTQFDALQKFTDERLKLLKAFADYNTAYEAYLHSCDVYLDGEVTNAKQAAANAQSTANNAQSAANAASTAAANAQQTANEALAAIDDIDFSELEKKINKAAEAGKEVTAVPQSGYVIFADKVVNDAGTVTSQRRMAIQWGYQYAGGTVGSETTVTYPLTFKSQQIGGWYKPAFISNIPTNNSGWAIWGVSEATATGFTARQLLRDTEVSGATTSPFYWFAIGELA